MKAGNLIIKYVKSTKVAATQPAWAKSGLSSTNQNHFKLGLGTTVCRICNEDGPVFFFHDAQSSDSANVLCKSFSEAGPSDLILFFK